MTRPKMSGEEFHRRVRAGPAERDRVIAELHRTCFRDLVGRFLKRSISRGEAEEYAAEVFLRLWRHCESLDARTPPIHWMNRVASHLIADHYRGLGSWSPTSADDPPSGMPMPEGAAADPFPRGVITADIPDEAEDVDHPRERADAGEKSRLVALCTRRAWQAFETDHPVDAEVLMAYAVDGMTLDEVQALLRCASPGAARERLSQMRKKLSKHCQQFCETPDCS